MPIIKGFVSIIRVSEMNNDIKVTEIEEHEDGSATLQVECDPETFRLVFNYGFVELIKNGIAKAANDPTYIRPMSEDEIGRATERAKFNKST